MVKQASVVIVYSTVLEMVAVRGSACLLFLHNGEEDPGSANVVKILGSDFQVLIEAFHKIDVLKGKNTDFRS